MTSGLAGNLIVLTGVLTPPPAVMTGTSFEAWGSHLSDFL